MANLTLLDQLPFSKLSNFAIENLFTSSKSQIKDQLESMGLKSILKQKLNPIQISTLDDSTATIMIFLNSIPQLKNLQQREYLYFTKT